MKTLDELLRASPVVLMHPEDVAQEMDEIIDALVAHNADATAYPNPPMQEKEAERIIRTALPGYPPQDQRGWPQWDRLTLRQCQCIGLRANAIRYPLRKSPYPHETENEAGCLLPATWKRRVFHLLSTGVVPFASVRYEDALGD